MKKLSFIVAYWWLLLMGALGVALLIAAPKEARASETENRMLQAMPAVSVSAVADGSFMREFETYLADAVFGRDKLITVSEGMRDALSVLPEENGVVDPAEELAKEMLAEPAAEEEPTASTAAETAEQAADADASVQETPSEDAETVDSGAWRMYMINHDGSERLVYTYSEANIDNAANVLNAYRAALPDDGNVFFFQIPFAATARTWVVDHDFTGWCSTVEDAIAKRVDEGVYVLNTPAVLSPYMEQEQLYFNTDHHWTPRGANHAVIAAQQEVGLPTVPYDEYSYLVADVKLNPAAEGKDQLELPELLEPAESWLIKHLTEQEQTPAVIYGHERRYMAFLDGTRGPWRRFVTGYHTGRKALIITDSYGNTFSPYLFPYYDEVFMTDYRLDYYIAAEAGGGARAYIEEYSIDDVYFVLATASGINSNYMLKYMMQHLDE